MITPTIAGGFGYADFDIPSTLGLGFPTDYSQETGDMLVRSATLQRHLFDVL
jgi:hypothetical protein